MKLTRGVQHGYPYRPGAANPTVRFRLEEGAQLGRPPAAPDRSAEGQVVR